MARARSIEPRIGTSGWMYKHWSGVFYPKELPVRDWLSFYSERLDTVELNNSFYRLPDEEYFRRWKETTPKNFLFSVKASRYLTHIKRLKVEAENISRLFSRVELLGRKLGPVLFQLPPRMKPDPVRLERFLSLLSRDFRYAFEFRDPAWFCEPVYEILDRFRAAFCIYEIAGMQSPEIVTGNWVYIRLHGPGGRKYQGRYNAAALDRWAEKINVWGGSGKKVFMYFDNDDSGYAVQNAVELAERLAA